MASILLIEDERSYANQLVRLLEREGHTVSVCYDGETGLQTAIQSRPDLVLLDIMLPELDGLTICRQIRANPVTTDILIIFLTSRTGEIDKIVGLEIGADDYLVKTISTGELIARIRSILKRKKNTTHILSDELRVGELLVDVAGRRTFLRDSELTLSVKEFDLLVVLMRNKNVVLSRDLLLARVWGQDYYGGDKRTVDVHIRWLREKIEDDPSNPMRIITVRGVGYKLSS